MSKYFIYILISVKREVYYKANMIGLVLTSLFSLIIQVKLWEAIYTETNYINGIGYSGVFTYLVVGMIFRKFIESYFRK